MELGRHRDHTAVGRAMTFTGLIPKFPLTHGAGRRKGERRRKTLALYCQRRADLVIFSERRSGLLHVTHAKH